MEHYLVAGRDHSAECLVELVKRFIPPAIDLFLFHPAALVVTYHLFWFGELLSLKTHVNPILGHLL